MTNHQTLCVRPHGDVGSHFGCGVTSFKSLVLKSLAEGRLVVKNGYILGKQQGVLAEIRVGHICKRIAFTGITYNRARLDDGAVGKCYAFAGLEHLEMLVFGNSELRGQFCIDLAGFVSFLEAEAEARLAML